MSLRGTLSSQLDVVEQRVGGLLVRTQLGWFGIEPGNPGQILAYSDEGIPEWKDRGNVNGIDSGWVEATLLNGWVNAGGGFLNAAYRRTAEGIVFFRGAVKDGGTGITNPIMVVPADFRWGYRQQWFTGNINSLRRIIFDADGSVWLREGVTSDFRLNGVLPMPLE